MGRWLLGGMIRPLLPTSTCTGSEAEVVVVVVVGVPCTPSLHELDERLGAETRRGRVSLADDEHSLNNKVAEVLHCGEGKRGAGRHVWPV